MGNSALVHFRRQDASSPIPESQRSAELPAYNIGAIISEGAFGQVYRATVRSNNAPVAIKIVDTRTELGRSFRRHHFDDELSLMRQLDHHFIIKIYEVFEKSSKIYYVMELAPNDNLWTYIKRRGHLDARDARDKTIAIVDGIIYLHETLGYVHGDLKCENIVMSQHNCAQLADFGFATKCAKGEKLTRWCGSLFYMCPELLDRRPYDGRGNDVWAIGVMLYAMAVGTLPFIGYTAGEVHRKMTRPGLIFPPFVPRQCERCLQGVLNMIPSLRLTLEELDHHTFMYSRYI